MPPALLHPVATLDWTAFTVHWSTVTGLLALLGLYEWRARAAARNPEGGAPPSAAQRARFVAGLGAIFLSLNGPLHDLSESYLFTAHMVQHLVLTLVVPPLLISGAPASFFRPALRWGAVARVARAITRPLVAYALFNVVLVAWHFPQAYELAVRVHPMHITQHLVFMTAAVIMWWPLLSPLPELPRLPYPMQLLYCFAMTIPMSIVAIFITYADSVLYASYASAPRVVGISPMEDQILGGLVMWIPGGFYFLGVMGVVFFRWAGADSDSVAAAQPASR